MTYCYQIIYFLFLSTSAFTLKSQDIFLQDSTIWATEDSIRLFEMPQITVLGNSPELLKKLPGTYGRINTTQLRRIDPITSNEILRRIPGLNVVDEEGAGLRINIGIRGLDPDRSRNVLLLEDGIPIALNPYGEPEMYFTPSIDRMSGVEVLKGSGQILFGPQTIGGVVNFISADPPETSSTIVRLRGGERGYFSAFASHGNTVGNTGFVINVLHKRAENLGPTSFELTDINAKLKFELNAKSRLGLKLGFYDETSNSTYIGLTQTMYDAGGLDFVRMAPDDFLPVRRVSVSLTHEYDLQKNIQLKTTAFGYTITRNWRRQDFSFNPNAGNQSGVVWGDPTVPNGAVYMLNSTGNRNRQFEVAGIEPQVIIKKPLANMDNELIVGGRFLFERAFEQFIVGAKPDASAGNVRDNEIRTGQGIALYVQNRLELSSRLSVSAGLRVENYQYEREILRGRFNVNGSTQVRDTQVIAANAVMAIIPGLGVSYQLNKENTLFGGVHRGFAPPRIKDAITSEGVAQELDPELSTNYELGIRGKLARGVSWQSTVFFMDFENQIIPISVSSGNLNETGLANGGQTRHRGIELGVDMIVSDVLDWKQHHLQLDVALTYVNSRYSADRFVGAEQINVRGNKLPYAPEWTFWAGIVYEWNAGLGVNINASFVDAQFADELNTIMASPNGRIGLIDARTVWDAGLFYKLKAYNMTFRINAKNLTDVRYIATRRPQGIRVGLPRLITGGFDIAF